MKTLFLSGSLLLCAAAWAQSPADPSVRVPTVTYRSVFADTPAGVEARPLDWRRANADVAQFPRGHADVLKWEQAAARATQKPRAAP
ncbi:hypothetical protein os1_19960 [Comamonadaceae bacterium OS-1]|nr:hypothetical protein os1_19960 [Comamonadaceae bacterium OS-1]